MEVGKHSEDAACLAAVDEDDGDATMPVIEAVVILAKRPRRVRNEVESILSFFSDDDDDDVVWREK